MSASGTDPAAKGTTIRTTVGGPRPVTLPALTSWRYHDETPEADPAFDDSGWTVADHLTTNNPTAPATPPVLYADDYGFHHGDVWYRGRYDGDPTAATVSLHYGGGGAGMVQAWLDGTFLGQNTLPTGVSSPSFWICARRPPICASVTTPPIISLGWSSGS